MAEASYGEAYRTPSYFLKMYRLRADMTQTELANKTVIKQHHISEMENSKRSIGKVIAKKLAQILDCRINRE